MMRSETVKIPPQVMSRQVGEEMVILDLITGTYYGLDLVGARMWQLMEKGESLSSICDTFIEEFDVTPQVLQQDLDILVRNLVDKGLISLSS